MKFICFAFLLFTLVSSAQSKVETEADSIYVFFDESLKYEDLHFKVIKNKTNMMYQYIYPDGKHLNFLAYTENNLAKKNFCRNKSYLTKIKSEIFQVKDFHSIGYDKMLQLLSKNKLSIFLIDQKDRTKKKVKMKRVYLKSNVEIKM